MLLQAGSILSYSTNVHPGENLAGVCRVLAEDVVRVRDAVCPGRRFGVELRLGGRAAAEIFPDHSLAPVPERVSSIQKVLTDNNLFLFSLNAFPLRDFHQAEVKRDVYLPDWTERARIDTTVQLCRLLAELLPEGIDGTERFAEPIPPPHGHLGQAQVSAPPGPAMTLLTFNPAP